MPTASRSSDTLPPRVVIAATHSGAGKTTVATGVLAALRRAGARVAGAKVGPDYIDPGYHRLATGRPSRNLDLWMCGASAVLAAAARSGAGADLLVVEGVMGLFDGAADGTASSTADVARVLDAPVVLVIDAASTGQSVAATVHGFATFDPRVRLAGVILNRVGSDRHEELLRAALADRGVPVLGALRRDDRLAWRDRHLGLVPVVERPAGLHRALDRLAETIRTRIDLASLQAIAATAPPVRLHLPAASPPAPSVRVGIASGAAFSFTYPDNLDALRLAGAELVPFDPLQDHRLPADLGGIVVGGGFPEVYAPELAANAPLLADLTEQVRRGLVVWAECGGLLWLSRSLDRQAMAGVLDAEATMTERLTLGYRQATTRRATPLGPAGTALRGHEFHYSTVRPAGDVLRFDGRGATTLAGFGGPRLLASYLHVHLAGHEALARRFVDACRASRQLTSAGPPA